MLIIILILLNLLNFSLQDPPYYPLSGEFDEICHTYSCGFAPSQLNAEVTGCIVRVDNDRIYLKECESDW